MRPLSLLGLRAAATVVAVVATQVVGVLGPHPSPRQPGVTTVTQCPEGPVAADARPVPLVADLDRVQVRESASRAQLLAVAEQLVAGDVPAVRPRSVPDGDPLRYLFDSGVALRRVVGILGYAYAATHDVRYRDALAAQTVGAVRWPDWNQLPGGHPLDTAQIGTAVALGYAWSQSRMTADERAEVLDALRSRLVAPYACEVSSGLAARRRGTGNQATVVATSVVLAGLAARGSAAWAGSAVTAGTAALARHATADGSGRSLADGPTEEGLMYTTFEAASVALLTATVTAAGTDRAVAAPLAAALPSLDALAAWNEHCARAADPAVQDGWAWYPWVDRTTALAAMAGSSEAGSHLQVLYEQLQSAGRLIQPGAGSWPAPDGVAELVLSQLTPSTAVAPAAPDLHAAGGPAGGRLYGCATYGATYALLTAVPNDAPHAHTDVGNVIVMQGDQVLLDDLGQRSYRFMGSPVWRAATKAHTTLGVAQPDGTVTQRADGSGAVGVDGSDLVMTTTSALPGVASWQRRVTATDGAVRLRDVLTATGAGVVPVSASFLLAAPPSAVAQQPDGSLLFTVGDGSTWSLVPPAGAALTVTDASPQPPYVDGPDLAESATAHTLVVARADVAGSTELVTELHRAP